MREVLENFPRQCEEALRRGRGLTVKGVRNVIVTGMGGSGFAGDVLRAVAGKEMPVFCNKDYHLPPDADKNTLLFAVSYSGNTEETLSALQEAQERKCRIIGISAGGQLGQLCTENNIDHIKIPAGIQPRHATGYLTIPMITVLEENHFIPEQRLELMIRELRRPEVREEGKQIAERFYHKIPLIYSSERLKCIAYGWKIRLNEDAKLHAFTNQFPELDHNEITGYTQQMADFHTLIIRDRDDHERTKKRMVITKQVIEDLGGECTILDTTGSTPLSRIFSALHTAQWASYMLALKCGVDPEPVEVQERFKKLLH